MKIQIELDEKRIEEEAIKQVVNALTFEAKGEMYKMVKQAIVGDVRDAVKAQISEMLKTMTFQDGKTFEEYTRDRLNGVKSTGVNFHAFERLGMQSLVDKVVQDYSHQWFNELIAPKMAEIKPRIKEELMNRILRESVL